MLAFNKTAWLIGALSCAFFAVTLFVSSVAMAGDAYYWHQAARHSLCENFPAGNEADGRQLYVSQAARNGATPIFQVSIDENGDATAQLTTVPQAPSWHLGKAGTHLKEGMTYSYGGNEYDVSRRSEDSARHYVHYMFCLTGRGQEIQSQTGAFSWVAASNGSIPDGAIRGFNRAENQYVCRMSWDGGKHPGKLIPASNACFIGYGGGEKASQAYEVLVYRP